MKALALVLSWMLAGDGGITYEELPPFEYEFEQFATPIVHVKRSVAPILDSPYARRYRTRIREAAKQPPNFAGHFHLVSWGCGTCCNAFAIIDLRTGRVYEPPFSMACGTPMDDAIRGEANLFYEPDSGLLVAVGSRNEGPTSGMYYYRWDGRALRLLKATHVRPNE